MLRLPSEAGPALEERPAMNFVPNELLPRSAATATPGSAGAAPGGAPPTPGTAPAGPAATSGPTTSGAATSGPTTSGSIAPGGGTPEAPAPGGIAPAGPTAAPGSATALPDGVTAVAPGTAAGPDLAAPVVDLGAGRGPAWLDAWLAANLGQVIAWRRALHAHPELKRREFRTTRTIVGVLRSVGLGARVLPIDTGVISEVGSGPRCVALRADIDALPVTEGVDLPFKSWIPGVAHACGHDAHTAILLGAAAALASAPELPGRVRLLFQPAEEEPGGAHDVIAAGGLEGVERIFGLHCDPKLTVGTVGTRVGPVTSACDMIELKLSAHPEPHGDVHTDVVHGLGVVATGLPSMLARRVDPRAGTVLAWGLMDAPGTDCGTPCEGTLRGTLRTGDSKVGAQLTGLVEEIVDSLLQPLGVRYRLDHLPAVPVVDNDATSTLMLQSAVEAAVGPAALVPTAQSSGGEDFGWYLEHVPGSYARLGVWSGEGPQCDLHQPGFRLDERAIAVGVRTMVHAALTALSAGA